MRSILSLATLSIVTASAIAQDPLMEVTNFRGVVSTATHPTTGQRYPYGPTTPPGYTIVGVGVAAGTRAWIYTPQARMRAGQQAPNYLTITGMTQVIRPGAGTLQFPSPAHYQFATGIAPVAAVTQPEGFHHAPTGADILAFPAGSVNITSGASFRHSFALATPVPMPEVELCLYVEYKGGEQQDDPVNNQCLRADWRGGTVSLQDGNYYGFTVGSNPRTISMTTDSLFRGQIGMTVQEPMFTATGFHANNYDPNPPLQGEDFRGFAASLTDWSRNGTVNATLFFHLSAGGNFANGNGIALANLGRVIPTIRIPTPFGNLMLNPADPMLTVFADAGVTFTLDPLGDYILGPANPILIPPVATLAGLTLTTQGAVLSQTGTAKLTNQSAIRIR